MSIHSFHISGLLPTLLACVLLVCGTEARTQDAVYVLKAGVGEAGEGLSEPLSVSSASRQPFDFYRSLIFFPARLDGRQGNFLLDTGAPTLLLNDRSTEHSQANTAGLGAGGEVSLSRRRVESLEFAGQQHDRVSALGLDLRAMEQRTGRSIDGFIGYEQLWNRELRIDYPNRHFSVLKSTRQPEWQQRAPDYTFRLHFCGHLPLLTLRVGNQKMHFILDTGAAVNLIDQQYKKVLVPTRRQINIQGLDGENNDCEIASLKTPHNIDLNSEQREFVVTNLNHLQESGQPRIAGILGSSFLSRYCVGIDYRRGKLYLWSPSKK